LRLLIDRIVKGETAMWRTIHLSLVGSALAALIAGTASLIPVSPAKAVVYCAVGVYRAGCVRRPPVARGCRYVVVNGVRVRRCY
jgi:hypothetical protein